MFTNGDTRAVFLNRCQRLSSPHESGVVLLSHMVVSGPFLLIRLPAVTSLFCPDTRHSRPSLSLLLKIFSAIATHFLILMNFTIYVRVLLETPRLYSVELIPQYCTLPSAGEPASHSLGFSLHTWGPPSSPDGGSVPVLVSLCNHLSELNDSKGAAADFLQLTILLSRNDRLSSLSILCPLGPRGQGFQDNSKHQ